MGAHLGRYDTERELESAAARSLHQMEKRIDTTSGEQAVIDRVGGNAIHGRSIDGPDGSLKEIGDHLADAIDAAGTDDIKELGGEFRERGTDASAGDHRGAGAAEEVRELAHTIEIRLQARQEHQVVSRAARRI